MTSLSRIGLIDTDADGDEDQDADERQAQRGRAGRSPRSAPACGRSLPGRRVRSGSEPPIGSQPPQPRRRDGSFEQDRERRPAPGRSPAAPRPVARAPASARSTSSGSTWLTWAQDRAPRRARTCSATSTHRFGSSTPVRSTWRTFHGSRCSIGPQLGEVQVVARRGIDRRERRLAGGEVVGMADERVVVEPALRVLGDHEVGPEAADLARDVAPQLERRLQIAIRVAEVDDLAHAEEVGGRALLGTPGGRELLGGDRRILGALARRRWSRRSRPARPAAVSLRDRRRRRRTPRRRGG